MALTSGSWVPGNPEHIEPGLGIAGLGIAGTSMIGIEGTDAEQSLSRMRNPDRSDAMVVVPSVPLMPVPLMPVRPFNARPFNA